MHTVDGLCVRIVSVHIQFTVFIFWNLLQQTERLNSKNLITSLPNGRKPRVPRVSAMTTNDLQLFMEVDKGTHQKPYLECEDCGRNSTQETRFLHNFTASVCMIKHKLPQNNEILNK